MNCFGCYKEIPDAEDGEAVFCKTCEDRRKKPREQKLSDPSKLEPSQFDGYSGPQSPIETPQVYGGFRDKPELDSEERLASIMRGGFLCRGQ